MMDLSDETLAVIGQMRRASQLLDDDIFMVGAIQNLAEVIGRIRCNLTDEDAAILTGVGAVFMKAADVEMKAQVQAFMAITR